MRIFHSRGRPVLNDEHSERYSNRTFKRVFRALVKARKYLAPMFATVADPFPEDHRVRHPALSAGTIKKIKAMRRQGFKVAAIAKELNVSQQTVRRYAKEGINEQRPRSAPEDVGHGEERRG
jgi:DNA invertase Pin-like site-specific DNA recombinase